MRTLQLAMLLTTSSLCHATVANARTAAAPSVTPVSLNTYPGYETVFETKSKTPRRPSAPIQWFVSGRGIIDGNRFVATEVGAATMLAVSKKGEETAIPIVIEPPTASGSDDRIADFDDIVPIATVAAPGVWQFFNANGGYRRIVANPVRDKNNSSARCGEVEKVGRYGSFGLAFNDGLLVTPSTHAVELWVRGETLTELGWIVASFEKPNSKGERSETEQWSLPMEPGKWNRVLIPIAAHAARYVRSIGLFPNPKSDAAERFLLDEAKVIRR